MKKKQSKSHAKQLCDKRGPLVRRRITVGPREEEARRVREEREKDGRP